MLKEHALEDERIKLSNIIRFFNEQKAVLKNLENELKNLKEKENTFLNGSYNPQIINNYNQYALLLDDKIKIQIENLKKIEIDIENQKKEVKKAYMEVKILEKLKEKQKEKYNKEFLLEEIKFTDDIMTSRKRA